MTDAELLAALDLAVDRKWETLAAACIRALIAERDQYRRLVDPVMDRAEKAEAERDEARALLRRLRDWLSDDRLNTWPYIENGDFHRDADQWLARIDAHLAKGDAP